MTGMPWVKSYTALLSNPRYVQLPDTARLHYRELLDLAGSLDAGGAFITDDGERMSTKDIACFLRTDLKALEGDIKLLIKDKFLCLNGNGPEISHYLEKQGPTQEVKRAAWRKRQEILRCKKKLKTITGDNPPVTGDGVAQSQSQESEEESDIESEEESSVKDPAQQPTDDDRSLTDQSKTNICKFAGIAPKYSSRLIALNDISPDDILAELARNYSRKGKVKNPGYITGMNLAKITPEKAAAEWYDQARWLQYLPGALK